MATGFLRVKGDTIVDGNGEGVVMRGAALGGWMKYADDQVAVLFSRLRTDISS